MRVVSLRGDGIATCDDEHGGVHEVAVELVDPIGIGERVLVHAGVAITRLGAGG